MPFAAIHVGLKARWESFLTLGIAIRTEKLATFCVVCQTSQRGSGISECHASIPSCKTDGRIPRLAGAGLAPCKRTKNKRKDYGTKRWLILPVPIELPMLETTQLTRYHHLRRTLATQFTNPTLFCGSTINRGTSKSLTKSRTVCIGQTTGPEKAAWNRTY